MTKSIEERAEIYASKAHANLTKHHRRRAYIAIATEQRAIDKELIDMLIGELYTSRAYHLGITALDSDAERAKKEKEGNTALIRGIDRTIKYVKEAMED